MVRRLFDTLEDCATPVRGCADTRDQPQARNGDTLHWRNRWDEIRPAVPERGAGQEPLVFPTGSHLRAPDSPVTIVRRRRARGARFGDAFAVGSHRALKNRQRVA